LAVVRYMSEAERECIFEDVKLQMDAKLWAEEYNRHSPPKKVRSETFRRPCDLNLKS